MSDKLAGKHNPWLLPEAVEELLPPAAAALEQLRRRTIDTCECWGYALIMPPTVEYLESLLSGVAHDLDLHTFKLTDQLSGRMMGVRADITPQAARIDAHQLRREGPVRLCYAGTVLRTRPEAPEGSRNPLQMGAELYGHSGIESDVEIIGLMIHVLQAAGLSELHLDLGHVGIFRGLAQAANLTDQAEAELWDALQRKATADIADLLDQHQVAEPHRTQLAALASLNGGIEVLNEAQKIFSQATAPVHSALAALNDIAKALQTAQPDQVFHVDLGELRGYHYHTGVVFAAYTPGLSQELARGGRYDDNGAVFGRARPATGFSTDLKALQRATALSGRQPMGQQAAAIVAPWSSDERLLAEVNALRAAGEAVIWLLPGHAGVDAAAELGADRQLQSDENGQWRVMPL
jgi:ATP phosphoribosyltransferase regulatory subunit